MLLVMSSCATVPASEVGPANDAPLPAGTYELTAHGSYRTDDEHSRHTSFASYATRLYVSIDGTTELYDGNQKCTDYADLSQKKKTGRRQPGPGHHFLCGGQTWSLWTHEGRVVGRMSAPVTEMVQSRMKCIEYSYASGRQVCERYGVEVRPHATRVSGSVAVRKVG